MHGVIVAIGSDQYTITMYQVPAKFPDSNDLDLSIGLRDCIFDSLHELDKIFVADFGEAWLAAEFRRFPVGQQFRVLARVLFGLGFVFSCGRRREEDF